MSIENVQDLITKMETLFEGSGYGDIQTALYMYLMKTNGDLKGFYREQNKDVKILYEKFDKIVAILQKDIRED